MKLMLLQTIKKRVGSNRLAIKRPQCFKTGQSVTVKEILRLNYHSLDERKRENTERPPYAGHPGLTSTVWPEG